MDALIKEFESRGLKVQIGARAGTELVLNEGVIPFRLDERTKQHRPATLPPQSAHSRHASYYEPWRPAFVLVATGEFTLTFERYRLRGCRNAWQDRLGSTLEALARSNGSHSSWEAALKAQRLDKERHETDARPGSGAASASSPRTGGPKTSARKVGETILLLGSVLSGFDDLLRRLETLGAMATRCSRGWNGQAPRFWRWIRSARSLQL